MEGEAMKRKPKLWAWVLVIATLGPPVGFVMWLHRNFAPVRQVGEDRIMGLTGTRMVGRYG